MYARVATWEGGEAGAIRRATEEIERQSEGGPPEGVPATGLTILVDPDGGRTLGITLFETEEDLRRGGAALEAMSPPGDGFGRRTSVSVYEVAVERRL